MNDMWTYPRVYSDIYNLGQRQGPKIDSIPGGRLNLKRSFYQYRGPHDKGKTVLRPSYI